MHEGTDNSAVWLSTPHQAMVEIANQLGVEHLVVDIEHGLFDLAATDPVIALALALGMKVHAKVLGPVAIPIQQALDMGCSSVIIPHIADVRQAARVCEFAKYPPLGKRSFSGTRPAKYGGADTNYYERENANTMCFPMIESAAALDNVEAILALPTVDGVMVGPSDLSLDRGRGGYSQSPADIADLTRIAEAANAVGKAWIMPAWTRAERKFAADHDASITIVADEFGALRDGIKLALESDLPEVPDKLASSIVGQETIA